MEDDDLVLNSIFTKITGAQGHSRASSDASTREKRRTIYKAISQPSSGVSFTGSDSFDDSEVCHGFDFSDDHPPSGATRRVPHRRCESALSIMSISYGHVINAGSVDPFDYGLPGL